MSYESEQTSVSLTTGNLEFAKLQFEQAVETYRTIFSLLVQISTVLVVADATIVGYAISTRIAGILLVGTLFPVVLLHEGYGVFKLTLPVAYTAIRLEHQYGGAETDWLASIFLSYTISAEYVAGLKAIISIQDPMERIEQMRNLPTPWIGRGPRVVRVTLILLAIGQIIAPIILTLFFGWRLF